MTTSRLRRKLIADAQQIAARPELDITKPKGRQGFASMTPERRRAISSMGGKSVPSEKRSFSQDRSIAGSAGSKGGKSVPSEARTFSRSRDAAAEAGRKGGMSAPAATRSFSKNRDLAVEAGRKGGAARRNRTSGQPVG